KTFLLARGQIIDTHRQHVVFFPRAVAHDHQLVLWEKHPSLGDQFPSIFFRGKQYLARYHVDDGLFGTEHPTLIDDDVGRERNELEFFLFDLPVFLKYEMGGSLPWFDAG